MNCHPSLRKGTFAHHGDSGLGAGRCCGHHLLIVTAGLVTNVPLFTLVLFARTIYRGNPMSDIIASRVTGRIDGDFVVFLIGMRINKPWKLHKWLPVARVMPKMLKELEAAPPEVGFLGHNGLSKTIVQYWRSFDHLERYARNREALHWPAWVEFNRRMNETRGDVGIWHETCRIHAGDHEAMFSGMPPFGLRPGRRAAGGNGSQRRAAAGRQPVVRKSQSVWAGTACFFAPMNNFHQR